MATGQVMDRIGVAVITWNWESGRFELKDQDNRGLEEALFVLKNENTTTTPSGY